MSERLLVFSTERWRRSKVPPHASNPEGKAVQFSFFPSTFGEQKLQTGNTVPVLSQAKRLKSLVVCAVICEPVLPGFRLRSGNFLKNSANNRLLAG
jgi:hypothetical protein